jgi:hypothetical protein
LYAFVPWFFCSFDSSSAVSVFQGIRRALALALALVVRLRRAGHVDRLARTQIRRLDGTLVLACKVFLRVLGRENGDLAFGRYGHCCGETE